MNGEDIILPILFSLLLANLLMPVTQFLESKKVHHILAILLPLILSIVLIVALIYFLSAQVMNFTDDVPALKERINEVSASFQKWVNDHTHITVRKQNQYINETVQNIREKGPEIASATVGSVTDILAYIFLIPIYSFLFLYYRSVIKKFLVNAFRNGSEEKVTEVLNESTSIAQQYLLGLLIETVIVFGLNTIGFLILGIKYPVFLALLAALLNLIPYVGMLAANVICMAITLLTSDSLSDVLWVGAILAIVQFIDNNFGMPLIVGNKVRINALVTIVGVLIGGALCGIPGMFLAIPALAVFKVVCDKVTELKPWGILLGDITETRPKLKPKSFSMRKKNYNS